MLGGADIKIGGIEVPVRQINFPAVLVEPQFVVRPQTGDGKAHGHSTLCETITWETRDKGFGRYSEPYRGTGID